MPVGTCCWKGSNKVRGEMTAPWLLNVPAKALFCKIQTGWRVGLFFSEELMFWCQDTSQLTRAFPTCVTACCSERGYGSSNANRIFSSKPAELWLYVLGLDEASSTWRQPRWCSSWISGTSFSKASTHHLHSYWWPRVPRYRVPRVGHTNSHAGSPCSWGGQAWELLCTAHMYTFT